jgi:hypothetical protein
MANEVQKSVRRFPWATTSGTGIGPAGMTADELKLFQGGAVVGKARTPDIAPIAQRGPVEFIAPTTSSENLRLAVPEAANPYATPLGPRHDHVMVRTALSRSQSPMARALMSALKTPPAGVSPEAAGQMRASLSREHSMLGLLQKHHEWQEQIYARIIGRQDA